MLLERIKFNVTDDNFPKCDGIFCTLQYIYFQNWKLNVNYKNVDVKEIVLPCFIMILFRVIKSSSGLCDLSIAAA